MSRRGTRSAPVALAAVAALAVPASAGAHIEVAVSSVKAHTSKADGGLDRAVALFEEKARARAERSFEQSRKQMGLARAEAAKMRRQADNGRERAQAARAQAVYGGQADENIPELVDALKPAPRGAESDVADAARSDARGRDKALAVISTLLTNGVPDRAEQGLMRALAALTTDRSDEFRTEASTLAGGKVAGAGKRGVVDALGQGVDGQATAAARLAELIASDDMPEQSKPGLQRAYDAVIGEQRGAARTLDRFSDRMPPRVRAFVEEIIASARENARELQANRPPPPRP